MPILARSSWLQNLLSCACSLVCLEWLGKVGDVEEIGVLLEAGVLLMPLSKRESSCKLLPSFLMPCCDPDLNSPMLELAILAEPQGAWSAGTPESSWDLFFPYTVHLIFPPSTARPCSHSVCLSIRCFLGTYFVPSTYETSPRQSRWTSLGPAHRTETGAGMETCPAKVGRCGFTFWRGCLSSSRV